MLMEELKIVVRDSMKIVLRRVEVIIIFFLLCLFMIILIIGESSKSVSVFVMNIFEVFVVEDWL